MESTDIQTDHFIDHIIKDDLEQEKNQGKVITRFPPEPNGYLHIGHAKSIVLNFGTAAKYQGTCNLRFDDTNPEKENTEFELSIKEDVEWLGYKWDSLHYSSDYFQQLHDFAVTLIKDGKAYVDSLTADAMREYRGTLTQPGKESPDRSHSIDHNLALFKQMKNGDFKDGERVLRAKIDMASSNINLRDPVIYRVKHSQHHRTGSDWCIYPMYDYTHCISDALENITHSLCTLEFEDHRPLYDWVLDQLPIPTHPQQIEFARLNLEYTIMSKRKLAQLVQEGHVSGWDDARMPTISGMRRRGYPAAAIREFCERIGVTKKDATIEMGVLENLIREDLNTNAYRAMAILDPLKVTIANYPEGKTEMVDAKNHPQNPDWGTREIPFSKTLYIEKSDFMEDAPKKFFRLSQGREVRFKYGYYLTCTDIVKNDEGEIIEVICTYDPETRGGRSEDGRKIKGTIHWVSAEHAIDTNIDCYDRLFNVENPGTDGEDFLQQINPKSLITLKHCKLEPMLKDAPINQVYQFERMGYFCKDKDGNFNRTMTLRDSWAKQK